MSYVDFGGIVDFGSCLSAKYYIPHINLIFVGETAVHAPYPLGGHVSKHVLVKSLLNLDSRVFKRGDWKLNRQRVVSGGGINEWDD